MVSQCVTTLFEHLFSLICTLSKHSFFNLFCTLSKKSYKYPLFEHLVSLICALSKHLFFKLVLHLSKKYKYPKDKIISCEELIYVFEEVIYVWKGLRFCLR